MSNNLKYTIAGLGLVIAAWLVFDTYQKTTAPSRELRDSTEEIQESLEKYREQTE